MKRIFVAVMVTVALMAAVAFSGSQLAPNPEIKIQSQERNPWTNLRWNNNPNDFQFAIVSDRTGSHRPRIFSQAVEQLNLLQPEFVLSVGDLVEGKHDDPVSVAEQWREFQRYVNKLQMPFFYVPGNHDLNSPKLAQAWTEKFGRRYYHFVYGNVLFLLLNSDDADLPRPGPGQISKEQLDYVKKALDENQEVRWTIVALHKPLWTGATQLNSGWLEVEKLLGDRPYTVFCGHIHQFEKFIRNGRNHYQLATTGGGSKMRGVRYGEFDHIVWVTMKKDGPRLANIMLDGIYPEDMKFPITDEDGVSTADRKPPQPTTARVFFEGCPTTNADVGFHLLNPKNNTFKETADGIVDADGTVTLSTYNPGDGVPVGDYVVTIVWRDPSVNGQSRSAPNLLPSRYSEPVTTDLRACVKEGKNEFAFDLKK